MCALPLFFGCGNSSTSESGESNDPKDVQIRQLQQQLSGKDSSVTEMFTFINDVEENLGTIESSQMKITDAKKNNEVSGDAKEKIMEHIQNINTLLDKNKQLIAKLEKSLRKSNVKVETLEKTIELLNKQVAEKDAEIADLKTQLEKLNFTVQELNAKLVDLSAQNDQQNQTIDQQTTELNTAYYVLGIKKDLKTKGIIDGDRVSAKANPANYNRVDIRSFTELSLNQKHVKLLSTHPEGSYELVMNGKIVSKLSIKNPKSFWSISKFLVIQTD